jgi:hypothetical protein
MAQKQTPAPVIPFRLAIPFRFRFDDDNDDDDLESMDDKNFLLRCVFDTKATTTTVHLDARQFHKLSDLIMHVREDVLPQALDAKALSALGLAPRFFLLAQETTGDRFHGVQFSAFHSENRLEYNRWYKRNITNGTLNELKIEVHALTADAAQRQQLLAQMRGAGRGGKTAPTLRKEYRQLALFSECTSEDTGTWTPIKPEDIDADTIKACIEARSSLLDDSTEEFFPARSRVAKSNKRAKKRRPALKKRSRVADEAIEAEGEEMEMEMEMDEDAAEDDSQEPKGLPTNTDMPMVMAFRSKPK